MKYALERGGERVNGCKPPPVHMSRLIVSGHQLFKSVVIPQREKLDGPSREAGETVVKCHFKNNNNNGCKSERRRVRPDEQTRAESQAADRSVCTTHGGIGMVSELVK